MNNTLVKGLIGSFVALSTIGLVGAKADSAIFGQAIIKPTTASENKNIIGKGSAAHLQGYWGIYYSTLAIQQANLAQYYGRSSNVQGWDNYLSAWRYSNTATTHYWNAYNYQIRGQ